MKIHVQASKHEEMAVVRINFHQSVLMISQTVDKSASNPPFARWTEEQKNGGGNGLKSSDNQDEDEPEVEENKDLFVDCVLRQEA